MLGKQIVPFPLSVEVFGQCNVSSRVVLEPNASSKGLIIQKQYDRVHLHLPYSCPVIIILSWPIERVPEIVLTQPSLPCSETQAHELDTKRSSSEGA